MPLSVALAVVDYRNSADVGQELSRVNLFLTEVLVYGLVAV